MDFDFFVLCFSEFEGSAATSLDFEELLKGFSGNILTFFFGFTFSGEVATLLESFFDEELDGGSIVFSTHSELESSRSPEGDAADLFFLERFDDFFDDFERLDDLDDFRDDLFDDEDDDLEDVDRFEDFELFDLDLLLREELDFRRTTGYRERKYRKKQRNYYCELRLLVASEHKAFHKTLLKHKARVL